MLLESHVNMDPTPRKPRIHGYSCEHVCGRLRDPLKFVDPIF